MLLKTTHKILKEKNDGEKAKQKCKIVKCQMILKKKKNPDDAEKARKQHKNYAEKQNRNGKLQNARWCWRNEEEKNILKEQKDIENGR